MNPPRSTHRLVVAADGVDERLDAYVAREIEALSRTRAARLIAAGEIRVNGADAQKSESLREGDVIDVVIPAPEPARLEAEPIPLRIIFQDADLAVVEKPAGLVVHPAPGHPSGTLVNALLHHLDDLSGIGGVRRPGIVHRLDKDTSGLLVVAKNDSAHRALSSALRRRRVRRVYLAAAWGHLGADRWTVDEAIGRSPRDRKKMAVVDDGRRAVTHIRRIERWTAADFLRVRLETGRTHQIRVHLAFLGHPIVADATYGAGGARGMSGRVRGWADEFERRVDRQFLHATELRFRHPRTNDTMVFESPLPEPLAAARAWASESSTPEVSDQGS